MTSTRPSRPGYLRRIFGCFGVAFLLLVISLLLLSGHLLHEEGIWGLWEKSTNQGHPAILALAAGPGLLFAGTESAGVFRSTDGGPTWEPFSRGLPDPQISALALSCGRWLNAAGPEGLLRSPVDRSSWESTGNASICVSMATVADPPHGEVLLASCEGRLLRSVDCGGTWVDVPSPAGEENLAQILPSPDEARILLLLGEERLWRSRDAGLAWEEVRPAPSQEKLARLGRSGALVADPSRPWILYGGTEEGFTRSQDSGATWQRSGRGLEDAFFIADVERLGSRLVAVTSRWSTLVSDDEGRTWSPLGNRHRLAQFLVVRPTEPCQMLRANSFERERSLDCGATWTRNRALPLRELASNSQNTPILYALHTHERTVLRSPDFGKTWQPVLKGSALRLAVHPRDIHHLWVAGLALQVGSHPQEGIAESLDGGRTWRLIETPFHASRISVLVPSDRSPGQLLIGTHKGAWRYLPDGGWTQIFRQQREVRDLFEDQQGRTDLLYACSKQGLFGSEDDGRSWARLGPPSEDCRRLVAVDGGSALLVVTEAQVYRLNPRPGWWMALWLLSQAAVGDDSDA